MAASAARSSRAKPLLCKSWTSEARPSIAISTRSTTVPCSPSLREAAGYSGIRLPLKLASTSGCRSSVFDATDRPASADSPPPNDWDADGSAGAAGEASRSPRSDAGAAREASEARVASEVRETSAARGISVARETSAARGVSEARGASWVRGAREAVWSAVAGVPTDSLCK